MADNTPPTFEHDTVRTRRRGTIAVLIAIFGCAILSFGIAALLTSIFRHKEEAKNPYLRLVDVTEETTDPTF